MSNNVDTTLPILAIKVSGKVTKSNLSEFEKFVLSALAEVNLEPSTDDEFGRAEKIDIKFCETVEETVKDAAENIVAQNADINAVMDVLQTLGEKARTIRLSLSKKVKTKKEELKDKIIREGQDLWNKFVNDKQKTFPMLRLNSLLTPPDFHAAAKGKRTAESFKAALKEALQDASVKAITKLQEFKRNLGHYNSLSEQQKLLFADLQQIISFPEKDFLKLIEVRIQQSTGSIKEESIKEAFRKEMPVMQPPYSDKLDAYIEPYMSRIAWGDFESKVRAVLVDFVAFVQRSN